MQLKIGLIRFTSNLNFKAWDLMYLGSILGIMILDY